MKTKTIRKRICKHCFEEFNINTSTHVFCCTSHRVAYFAMNKRLKTPKLSKNLEQEKLAGIGDTPRPYAIENFLKDVASATVGGLIIDTAKTLRGINDKDQMELLKRIELNQIMFHHTILTRIAMLEETIKKNNQPYNLPIPFLN